jgi:hypothetical protein
MQDIGNNVLNAILSGRPREEVVEEVHTALRWVCLDIFRRWGCSKDTEVRLVLLVSFWMAQLSL